MREHLHVAENKAQPRRIVKKADSLRQQAEKNANKPAKKQGIVRLSLRYIGAPFVWVGRSFAKFGRFKPLRIIGKILWPTYFRNSWKELRQVTWPGRREAWQLTGAVLLFSAIFGILITLVDYGLDKVFKQVLLK
jgi:preprotein translocase SecE subunit